MQNSMTDELLILYYPVQLADDNMSQNEDDFFVFLPRVTS